MSQHMTESDFTNRPIIYCSDNKDYALAYVISEYDLQSEIKMGRISGAAANDIRSRTLSDELIKERNLVLDEIMAICKNSKNTIEHRHDATYHAEARMDEVTDIIIKVSSLCNGMIK